MANENGVNNQYCINGGNGILAMWRNGWQRKAASGGNVNNQLWRGENISENNGVAKNINGIISIGENMWRNAKSLVAKI